MFCRRLGVFLCGRIESASAALGLVCFLFVSAFKYVKSTLRKFFELSISVYIVTVTVTPIVKRITRGKRKRYFSRTIMYYFPYMDPIECSLAMLL